MDGDHRPESETPAGTPGHPTPGPVAPSDPAPLPSRPGYRTKRLEKQVAIAQQSWSEFFRDLALRTAAIAVAMAIILGLVWLLGHR